MIRLVATDLDGTFWDPDLIPPRAHVMAANELIDAGVTVLGRNVPAAASGRSAAGGWARILDLVEASVSS